MQTAFRIIVLVSLLMGCENADEAYRNCEVALMQAVSTHREINLTLRSGPDCPGYRIRLDTPNDSIVYRVNFTDRIVENAPPYGFSIKKTDKEEFESLGVDGNLVSVDGNGIRLDPSSRIRIDKDTNATVWWRWHLGSGTDILCRIRVEAAGKTVLKLERIDKKSCRKLYDAWILRPRHLRGSKPILRLLSWKRFEKECSRAWSLQASGAVMNKWLLGFDTDRFLKPAGRFSTPPRDDRNGENARKRSDACTLYLGVVLPDGWVDGTTLRSYLLEKLNKERYEKRLEGNEIRIYPGVYRIRLLGAYRSKNPWKNVICNGAEEWEILFPHGEWNR